MEHNHSLSPVTPIISPSESEGTRLSSFTTPQPPEEIAEEIQKIAGRTYVFALSVYDIADQAVRRVEAFYAWSKLREQDLQQRADLTYETLREKADAIVKLFAFDVKRSDMNIRLNGHLNAIKRLLELFMNEELAKLVLAEDLVCACIMAWVVINHGTETQWGYAVTERIAWHAEFVRTLKVDARQLYRFTEINCSNRTHRVVEFDQIYIRLLDFFTQHCGIKPPEADRYSISELVELIAFEFPTLKGLKNAVSCFLSSSSQVFPEAEVPK